MIFHSIKWRILAWNYALLAVVVTVLLIAFHRHEAQSRMQWADVKLRQALVGVVPGLHILLPEFGRKKPPADREFDEKFLSEPPAAGLPPPPPSRPPMFPREGEPAPPPGGPRDGDPQRSPEATSRELNNLRSMDGSPLWCASLTPEGALAYRSDNAPAALEKLFPFAAKEDPEGSSAGKETTLVHEGQRVLIHTHPGGDLVIIGMPVAALEADSRKLAWALIAAGVGIVGAGCTIGWIVAGRSLRPISRISAAAERIAAGDYAGTIAISETESELGRLAVVLNNTFSNLNTAREQILRFTADASHELRTPLSVILAGSQSALKRDRTPEEYRETIESTERAARRMKSLSDDLLELARGGAGKETLQTFPCDLADLADETVAMLAPLAKQHGAELVTELTSCPVEADPVRFGRVIVNLVSNSILHNGDGVKISVFVRPVGGKAVIEIMDTGKGIPVEHLEKIFDRFHRADASRSRNTGGSGLGLAIVKQTVEIHGGTITVKSAVGEGTTFTLVMPLRAEAK